ncbi:hypothetical protein REPUB_Repub04eG0219100 [Reevesia pubescens]
MENASATLIRKVASKINDTAGDGTTTTSILAREIIKLRLLSVTSGANPVSVKRSINKIVQGLVEELEKKAKPVKGCDDIKVVASISVGNDDLIGIMVADAIDKVGPDAIENPGFGEKRKALLQDIAIFTGSEFQACDLGLLVENTLVEQLGIAKKVIITKDSTQLIAEAASKDEILARVAQLKKELSLWWRAAIETELEDRRLQIEDVKNAAFAAIEEGIVPSGGGALVYLSTYVPAIKEKFEEANERLGGDIVQKALVAPALLIAENARMKGELVVEKVKIREWEIGYNAMIYKYENLQEAGVIDPTKVTRCALHNASSVAGIVLTTQAIVVVKAKLTSMLIKTP